MPTYPGYALPFATASSTNYGYIIAAIIFYAFVFFSAIYSVATMFILIRHAQSKVTALGASFIFGVIYLYLFAAGVSYLNVLK
jgi:hypothetical protein